MTFHKYFFILQIIFIALYLSAINFVLNLQSVDFYDNKLDYYIFFIKSFTCYLRTILVILFFS